MLGFKRFETAAMTIRGIELAEKIKKNQFNLRSLTKKEVTVPSALGGDLGGIEPRKIILPKRTSIYRELHQNRSSKVSNLSFFRVVAMMWAPASAAMLRAARPKAEVAPHDYQGLAFFDFQITMQTRPGSCV